MRQINLLPETVRGVEKRALVAKAVMVLIGSAAVIILLSHFFLLWRISCLKKTISHLRDIGGITAGSPLDRQLNQSGSQIQKYIDENKALTEVLTKDFLSLPLLKTIGDAASGRVWLTAVTVDSKTETCQISGNTYNTQLVSEFMLELKRSPFFKNIDLASMEKGKETQLKEMSFTVTCEFK